MFPDSFFAIVRALYRFLIPYFPLLRLFSVQKSPSGCLKQKKTVFIFPQNSFLIIVFLKKLPVQCFFFPFQPMESVYFSLRVRLSAAAFFPPERKAHLKIRKIFSSPRISPRRTPEKPSVFGSLRSPSAKPQSNPFCTPRIFYI